ncbi:hypothetical protein OIO90_002348 [Microbotryomycetes sp. JL221]|nr:hypothetical protein OIO90_002348 [Microbotryomycetes sp. JL221]
MQSVQHDGGSLAPSPRPGTGPGTRAQSQEPDASGSSARMEGGSGGGPGGGGDGGGRSTNVGELMDAVGASGVDINAEEEGLRALNERLHARQRDLEVTPDQARKQDFIDPGVLAECVKKIAAAFQLRTLEPDTIPFIALATRARLATLINDSINARDHRRFSSHLRRPPMTTERKRKRTTTESDFHDEFQNQDDNEENDFQEFNFETGEIKIKQPKQKVAAWDTIVFEDTEKLLGVIERVDREEERRRRRERMLRDQKEEEERALAEAIAESERAEQEANGGSGGVTGTPASGGPSTPRPGGGGAGGVNAGGTTGGGGTDTPIDKDGKPLKKKSKKKASEVSVARNMSEDVKKRLTDQVAMRWSGTKNFAWLNPGSASGSFGSPTPSNLPKPKFAPGSSLPPPTFAPSTSSGLTNGGNTTLGSNDFGTNQPSLMSSHLTRLSGVPPLHDAQRESQIKEDWERGRCIVEMSDLLFVLDRERGAGIGKGSGRNVLLKGRAGIIKR